MATQGDVHRHHLHRRHVSRGAGPCRRLLPPPPARTTAPDDAPPPPPPPPKRLKKTVWKADTAATKAAGKTKPANPAQEVDAKVKTKIDAAVTRKTTKSAVPKPTGAEIKKDSTSDVKTRTKAATKPGAVRKGAGGRAYR